MNVEDFEISKEQLLEWVDKMIDCDDSIYDFISVDKNGLATHGVDIQLGNNIMELRYHHRWDEDGSPNSSFYISLKYIKSRFLSNGEDMRIQHNSLPVDEMEYNKIMNKITSKAYKTRSEITSEFTSYFRNTKLNKLVD